MASRHRSRTASARTQNPATGPDPSATSAGQGWRSNPGLYRPPDGSMAQTSPVCPASHLASDKDSASGSITRLSTEPKKLPTILKLAPGGVYSSVHRQPMPLMRASSIAFLDSVFRSRRYGVLDRYDS